MTTTAYFQEALSLERSTVADEFYERHVGSVFVKEASEARLEVQCWTRLDLEGYQKMDRLLPQLLGSTFLVMPQNQDAVLRVSGTVTCSLQDPSGRQILPATSHNRLTALDLNPVLLRRFVKVCMCPAHEPLKAYHTRIPTRHLEFCMQPTLEKMNTS